MTSSSPSLAMIFAAGLGTRMRPLTLTCPKPLIRVNGRALLDRCLDVFTNTGIEEAIVNVHWLADQIEAHVANRTHPHITIADERPQLLGQAGALRILYQERGDIPIFMSNTDAFWVEDVKGSTLKALRTMWDPAKTDILLALAPRTRSIGAEGKGDFWLTPEGRLSRGDPEVEAPFIFSGVGIISLGLFAHAPPGPSELSPYLSGVVDPSRLYGLPIEGQWFHVGTPEMVAQVERDYDWV